VRVSLRTDEDFAETPFGVGLHVHGYQVALNPEADTGYVALEDPAPGALYRLSRRGRAIERARVPDGQLDYCSTDPARLEAVWWFTEALGDGSYYAAVTDRHGRSLAVFFGISQGRLCDIEDAGEWAIEALFADCGDTPDDPYPNGDDLARMAAEVRGRGLP
jgi:hypothetical protein